MDWWDSSTISPPIHQKRSTETERNTENISGKERERERERGRGEEKRREREKKEKERKTIGGKRRNRSILKNVRENVRLHFLDICIIQL